MPRWIADTISSYDLHLHTSWSYDATAEVEMHFHRARELGVRCIAITEHHHMDSLPEVLETAGRYPDVRIIPAAELSVTTSIGAVDLLCYGLPVAETSIMTELFEEYHRWQRRMGAAISAGMQALGFDFTDERRRQLLRTYRPEPAIARQGITHVKNAVLQQHFIECGYVSNEQEYTRILAEAGGKVPRPPYPAVERVVRAVHEVGGLVAIAHPPRYFLDDDRPRMDALREECRLDGIECAHPNVDPALTPLYEAYCQEHGLVPLAGSDCHGQKDIERMFARHGGRDEWLDLLLARLDQRR